MRYTPADDKSCTLQLFPEGLPTPEWLPEQLMAFAQAQHRVILNAERALAVEHWRLGKGLELLRSTFTYGEWEQFLKTSKIETSKACRARAIARTFTKEEDLAGLTVQQAYAARKRRARPKVPPTSVSGQNPPGQFARFLQHVDKLAEPFIDHAGFAEAEEAATLLPEVERVLDKFDTIRKLLLERIAQK